MSNVYVREVPIISDCRICGMGCIPLYSNLQDRMFLSNVQKFKLVQCHSCNAIQIPTNDIPKDMSPFYPSNYYSQNLTKEEVLGKASEVIKSMKLDENSKFLDYGSGNAILCDVLFEQGVGRVRSDLMAYDPFGTQSEHVETDITKLPIEYYTHILSSHSIEHTPYPFDVINSAYQLLKPGGKLNVIMPNADGMSLKLFGKDTLWLDVPRHLTILSEHGLKMLMRQVGFKDIKDTVHCGSMGDPFMSVVYKQGGNWDSDYKGNKHEQEQMIQACVGASNLFNHIKKADTISITAIK